MKILMETVNCPLGCQEHDEIIVVGSDILHGLPGEFIVVACKSCGLMRTNPRPTPESISVFYPDDYGPYLGTRIQEEKKPTVGLKKIIKPLVKRLFDFNTTRLPNITPTRLLEIGCASGSFLDQMAKKGWQVEGIEFSEKAAQAAIQLGYHVHIGSLETAPKPEKPFDLIVGWMVLEHLHDPIAGLKKLRECATSQSWLVFSVPNAGSLEFRLFKDKWYALQLPTHLHHFTPKTIKYVLQAGGWTIDSIYHQRTLNNLIVSSGYVLRDRGFLQVGNALIKFPQKSYSWSYVLFPLAWLFSVFGQTGRMTIWARPSS